VVTPPPGQDLLLYDGDCAFCRREAARLVRWLPEGAVAARSFREPGALQALPDLDAARCQKALQLVRADGRVFSGAEGLVQALRHRRLGLAARLYYLPPLRQLVDAGYALVARNRHRLAGQACAGACAPPSAGGRVS
jgi:predicted DCC family thiol-disulfide oxidoreductase YuxK